MRQSVYQRKSPMFLRLIEIGILASLLNSATGRAASLTSEVVFFEEKIRPVLSAKCYRCHSAKKGKDKGGLMLDSRAGVLKGGDSGPVLAIGKPAESHFISRLRIDDQDERMPPDEVLPEAVIKSFEQWIRDGAVFPDAPIEDIAKTKPWWDGIDKTKLASPKKPIAEVIDEYIDAKLARSKVKPVSAASDANYLRRVMLDLVGRIPSVAGLNEFVESDDADKVVRLVNRLMKTPGFARHQVTEWEWRLVDGDGRNFRKYLERAVDERRSWDQVFREIIVADEFGEPTRHSSDFIRKLGNDLDKLANDVSVRFFGVNISCAQCHDHPLVPAWKQDHYYGMKSFFSRTFLNGDFPAERAYGTVSFKTTKGEEKKARLMFLTGTVIDEPESKEPDKEEEKKIKDALEKLKKEKKPVPAPDFSRRAQLARIGVAKEQGGFFARAAVNFTWHRLMGRGLVMPLDQLHGQNQPSHPELLAWLARDFETHGFDLNRLIRGIVLSRAYARESRWRTDDRPESALFAVAIPRPMTPHQMGAALRIATSDPEAFISLSEKPEELEKRVEDLAKGGSGWVREFPRQTGEFQLPVEEALYLSNNDRIVRDLLRTSGGTVLNRILANDDDGKNIRMLFRAVLTRIPSDEEVKLLSNYVKLHSEKPSEAWQQVLWAMLSGVEFRFNH